VFAIISSFDVRWVCLLRFIERQQVLKKNGLLRSTSLVSGNTVISRILGFLRDMIWAQIFGAGPAFDAFIIAFKLPNFMRRLFAEGAFAQAFVPVLSQQQTTKSFPEVKQFIRHMSGTLSVALVIAVIIGVLGASVLVDIFAPGFVSGGARHLLAVHLLQITFPYLFFISLVALSGAILNTYGSYGVPSFTPVFFNVCLILAAVYLAPKMAVPVVALAWGLLAAGVVQLVFQLPFLRQKKLLVMPQPSLSDPGVRRVLKLMVPALFGVSVAQVSILMDTLFASFLPQGSITWLYFSERLMNFPLGVVGVGIATVVLPYLSRGHAKNNHEHYNQTMDWALRLLLLIGIPASLGLFILAGPLLATLFGHGKFNAHDVLMSRQSLMAFAVGVQGFMLVKVLASGFYAKQNIKTPVKIAAVAMVSNVVLNVLLIFPLAHAGIALATSLAGIINAALLLFFLLKQKIYSPLAGWKKYAIQLLVANGLMGGILYWQSAALSVWVKSNWRWQVPHLLLLVLLAAVVYFSVLWLMGLRFKHFLVHPR
jgi:putative peptidoglycan lipid II flippase